MKNHPANDATCSVKCSMNQRKYYNVTNLSFCDGE